MSVHPTENVDPTAVLDEGGSSAALSCLAGVEKCYVQQIMDSIQAVTGIDLPNKYSIVDEDDKQILFMEEKNKGSIAHNRAFTVVAADSSGQAVFSVSRDYKPWSYCCFCCAGIGACKVEADVKIGGKKKAEIKQRGSFASAQFVIEDDDDDDVFRISGHSQFCLINTEYDIMDKKGKKKIGSMDKEGGPQSVGCNRYKVKFPEDATPEQKAMLLSMSIVLDYRFHYFMDPRMQHRRR